MFTEGVLAAAVLAAAASATAPNNTTTSTPTSTGGDGCATVSQLRQETPEATLIPASLAYDCLQSVPVDEDGDAQLVKEIKSLMNWQSTLAYLKDPPEGYPNPPVDILGGLDDIATKLSDGGYSSEYDVQLDISQLLAKAYDGHTAFTSDIASILPFGKVDNSGVSVELVSLSSDGKSLPKIYLLSDVLRAQRMSNFTFSAVSTINNQSATAYLTQLAEYSFGEHDADGRYQSLFWDPAQYSYDGTGSGFFQYAPFYQGDSTVLGFENGTEFIVTHVAGVKGDFADVDSGAAFFERFCTGLSPTSTDGDEEKPSETSATPSSTPLPTAFNYPYPIAKEAKATDNSVSGYFLNDTRHRDVAVLSSASFAAANLSDFQAVVSSVLAAATAANKTRLIVDLRRNGGGKVALGYDLFKQLFPQLDPYGGTRARAFAAYDAMGSVITAVAAAADLAGNATALAAFSAALTSPLTTDFWARAAGVDASGGLFPSWQALYGPDAAHGDAFTRLVRQNYNDSLTADPAAFVVSGYQNRSNLPPQPFRADDIVLLHDGYCASTCAVFSELMKAQGGVRAVAIGGRPRAGPMVGVGGTKGAQTLAWDAIVGAARDARSLALAQGTDDDVEKLEGAGVFELADAELVLNRTAAGEDGVRGSINYRNNIRMGDAGNTPLQFVEEYADYRVWYTPRMMVDPAEVWRVVADAAWWNGTCVEGSTGKATTG